MPQFPRFFAWYERHYRVNVSVAAALFTLQLAHLWWLTTDVVAVRLLGEGFFSSTPFWEYLIIAVDYTEIPAIITTSILYVYELHTHGDLRNFGYLLLINSQWLHIVWITDEFVVSAFRDIPATSVLPAWLAWIAIGIDYLELPVIIDTVRRAMFSLKPKKITFFERIKRAARTYLWRL